MKIKDALKSFYPTLPGSYYKLEANKKLSKEMTAWAKGDKFMAFLNLVFKYKNKIAADPFKVEDFLSDMGYTTIEDLTILRDFVNDSPLDLVGMFKSLFPTIPHSWFTKRISMLDIMSQLKTQTGYKGEIQPALVSYRLIPDDKIQAIPKICNSNDFRYLINSGGMDGQFSGGRMCRGFTRMTLGWLAQIGLDDLAIGEVKAERFYKGKATFGHDFLFMLSESLQLWFWDGIDDKVWKASDIPALNRCDLLRFFGLWF